jgi:hypothetical protein
MGSLKFARLLRMLGLPCEGGAISAFRALRSAPYVIATGHLKRLTARMRRTSSIKRASKGEVLSRLHASASDTGMFKSTTGKTATVRGHRQRALPSTHPTPKPVDTRLRIVASLSPSWTIRGDFKPPR